MRRYGTFFPPAFPRSHVKKRMIRSTNPSARFVVLTGSAIGLNYRILRNCRVFDSQLAELQRILLETEIPGIDVLNREHWRDTDLTEPRCRLWNARWASPATQFPIPSGHLRHDQISVCSPSFAW